MISQIEAISTPGGKPDEAGLSLVICGFCIHSDLLISSDTLVSSINHHFLGSIAITRYYFMSDSNEV